MPGHTLHIPHNMSTSSDPNADLYAFIFNMIENQPSFKVGPRKEPKAPLSQAMLARPYKGILPESYAVEPKIDGVRVIVEVCRQTLAVAMKTRNGNPLPSIAHLGGWFSDTASKHGVFTFDCEAVSGADFYDSVGDIRSSEPATDARLWLLDIPDDVGTYGERRTQMAQFTYSDTVQLVESFMGISPNDAFRRFVSQGFEGAMVKDVSAPYAQGKRSNAWLKVKAVDAEDCPVVSVHEGEGRLAGTMGHVVVENNGRLIRVGGGFTDEQRRTIWANRDTVIGSWLEVTFQSKTPDGSMRHPRIRGDK
jgi:ATP-dependent DNA ligase